MANSKTIGGIVVIIIIIIVAAFVMSDSTYTTNSNSVIAIDDSAMVNSNPLEFDDNNPDYSLDDDGSKSYVISAKDSPEIGD